jgi:hypothetical protein
MATYKFTRLINIKLNVLKINYVKKFDLLKLKDLKKYLKYEIKSENYEILNLPKIWEISQGGKISVWVKSINLYEFTNAQFVPYSDFIRIDEQVYWDKLDSFQLIKTIPLDSDLVTDNRNMGSVQLFTPKKELKFETVFSLCGVHVNSWGHFVGNFLAKIATIKGINNNEIIVILPKDVDEHIKNIIFDLLKKIGNFKIEFVSKNEIVICEKLYYCSAPSFIADHALYLQPTDTHITQYSKDKIYELMGFYNNKFNQEDSCKIYIARRGVRNLKNYEEVENYFFSKGYKIIYPHKLDFNEKIRLFSNASHICGPFSSGFANLIFCKPEVKVLVFCNYSRIVDGYVSAFEGEPFNLNVTYLSGYEDISADPHNSYTITLKLISEAADKLGFFK